MPPPIVEAFRKSACATTTVADSAEQAELGLQCGHAPDIEEAPLDLKTTACPDTSPEPQPTECSTCCYPFAKEDLFGCRTEQCSYLQCASCILKGGGGVCRNPECNFVYWECPACTEPGGGNAQLRLTDARFSNGGGPVPAGAFRYYVGRAIVVSMNSYPITLSSTPCAGVHDPPVRTARAPRARARAPAADARFSAFTSRPHVRI